MELNLPQEFKLKYKSLLGDRASRLFDAMELESSNAFRLNPLKENYENVSISMKSPIEYSKLGFFGDIDGNSIDHLAGYLYSQEPSAMFAAEVVNPSDEKVLDLCAAPGSKSTHLASKMMGQGLLVSNEINDKRARILSSNIERMGISNTVVTSNSPKDFEKSFSEYFDKILVDAPCSGEGMFRKDPESVKFWSQEYVEQCANRQKNILNSAYKLLKVGGTLVYSTCTFAPEENEQNIAYMLEKYPDLEISEIEHFSGMEDGRPEWENDNTLLKKTVRMFPDEFDGEGHFICKLIKSGDNEAKKTRIKEINNNLKKEDLKLFRDFEQQNLTDKISETNLLKLNNYLINAASLDNRFKDLHVLRNGLKLGEFKKNRLEPDIAWILGIQSTLLNSVYNLNEVEFEKYLHGEALKIEENFDNKWIGLKYQDKLFSWGRYSNNQIKNVYPKGLRR
ncbi:RsmB/NOP family class I SAM-dependent RNA methyltransferase [Lactobacillus terrae]|uniref:RsmB/NOP family class I SAM-dependent RNA methyltransferase n=1 Tax=Lactobacillus terrae TaxID=2269374 RepID=UPI000C1B7579|nr:RsmF rRNA methyltransferase first C-terminal domain-containing protein [Lactobacillus terrae]